MTARDAVAENHTLIVRDGRIIDLLPTEVAVARYRASVHVDRPHHVLLPGLVNAYTAMAPGDVGAMLGIAAMLKSGTTCFCCMNGSPEDAARVATAQGMRILIGLPICERPSSWADNVDEYITRALRFRDEHRGHPTIATAFAPAAAAAMGDASWRRIATLAAELDAGVVMSLHASHAEIDACLTRHGQRPLERLRDLELLTPALTAAHMTLTNADDLALAQLSGIAIVLCPRASLRVAPSIRPLATWTRTAVRVGLGTGTGAADAARDPWNEMTLLAALTDSADTPVDGSAWDLLAAATRGAAAALGLDTQIGTLEPGKWADVCCVDLHEPGLLLAGLEGAAVPPIGALSKHGARDMVNDIWVAGRALVYDGQFTRLDWPALLQRVDLGSIHSTGDEHDRHG